MLEKCTIIESVPKELSDYIPQFVVEMVNKVARGHLGGKFEFYSSNHFNHNKDDIGLKLVFVPAKKLDNKNYEGINNARESTATNID